MFNKNTIMLTVLCILFTGLLSAQTALFEVKDTSGNTIFAVFEDGIIVKDSEGNDVFIAETDSVRVYLNEGTTDVGRGGFAIGSVASRSVEDYLFVAPDSSRVYVDGDGGFSIGDIGTGSAIDYLKLTPENYFIGHESGLLTSGLYNSFIGYQAGKTNWT